MVECYGQFGIIQICSCVDCLKVKITSAEHLYTNMPVTSHHHHPLKKRGGIGIHF